MIYMSFLIINNDFLMAGILPDFPIQINGDSPLRIKFRIMIPTSETQSRQSPDPNDTRPDTF
jgi:hypothetical protein